MEVRSDERSEVKIIDQLSGTSSDPFLSTQSVLVLDNVMEALRDPNTHLIGVYSSNAQIKHTLLHRLGRRIARDNLFNVVLTAYAATVSEKVSCCFSLQVNKKADMKKIQDQIAGQLRLTFKHKSKHKRARELWDKIKEQHKMLIIVCDVEKGLDLEKLGIPFGANHSGCKILLTSTHEEVLFNQMHTHKNFML